MIARTHIAAAFLCIAVMGGAALLGQAPLAWEPVPNGVLAPITAGGTVTESRSINRPTGGTPGPAHPFYLFNITQCSWGNPNVVVRIQGVSEGSPYAFRLLIDPIPLGLAGTHTITLRVRDFATPRAELSVVLTLEVLSPGLSITSPGGQYLYARNGYVFGPIQVQASNGVAPYTYTLDASTDWAFLGIGLVNGDTLLSSAPMNAPDDYYYCRIVVTDAAGNTAFRVYTVIVLQPMSMSPPIQFHGGSGHGAYHAPLGDWIEGVPLEPVIFAWDYSEPGPMTFTLSGEPAGLMLDTANATFSGVQLVGTPAIGSAGQYTMVVRAVDSIGQVAERTLELLIRARPSITTTAFPIVAIGENIAAPITVVDGVPPYTFSAAGLPRGISIDPVTGVVSGTVLEMPLGNIVLSVTDSFHIPQSAMMTVEFPIELTVLDSTLRTPPAVSGAPYSHAFVAIGGMRPYAWSISGLPSGMTYDPATGTISGTPIELGHFTVRIDVADSSTLAPQSYTTLAALNVSETGIIPPAIVSTILPAATEGAPYAPTAISVTGGQPAYTFDVTGLPEGMDGSDGIITGGPAIGSAGRYLVRIVVTDAAGQSTSTILSLSVNADPTQTPEEASGPSPISSAIPNLAGGAAACSLVHGRTSVAGVAVLLAIAIGIACRCVMRRAYFVAPCALAWRQSFWSVRHARARDATTIAFSRVREGL